MSAPTLARSSNGPTDLLKKILGGGALADAFQRAAREQLRASSRLIQGQQRPDLASRLHNDAHTRLQQGVNQSPLKQLHACQAGCSSCCFTPVVDVTPIEALSVAEFMKNSFDAEELSILRLALQRGAERRAKITPENRENTRLACSFLGPDGKCRIYAARPLVCAGVFSLSRERCEEARDGETVENLVPLDRPSKAWLMGVSSGLQHALVRAQLDGNLYEFQSAVVCALDHPRAFQAWLEREDVFASALCTDPHSPPRTSPLRIDAPHATVKPPKAAFSKSKAPAK